MRMKRHRDKGFTMTEIMVVVIVIGVLAALVLPPLVGRLGKAKQGVAKGQLAVIESAIGLFYNEYDRFPTLLEELLTGPADVPEEDRMPASIKKKNLIDPWDRLFVYKYPGDHYVYDLYCLGRDGHEGGEAEDADIVNWDE